MNSPPTTLAPTQSSAGARTRTGRLVSVAAKFPRQRVVLDVRAAGSGIATPPAAPSGPLPCPRHDR